MIENFRQISFKGKNAIKFCHDYTISSLSLDDKGSVVKSAFLDKKGRVVTTALLSIEDSDEFIAIVPDEICEKLLLHLDIYIKFSRISVDISDKAKIDQKYFSAHYVFQEPMPWINIDCSARYTISDLCLDLLGWVDFEKGCYLGQEIVSRMHFKSKKRKKHLVLTDPTKLTILPKCYQGESFCLAISEHGNLLTAHQSWGNTPE